MDQKKQRLKVLIYLGSIVGFAWMMRFLAIPIDALGVEVGLQPAFAFLAVIAAMFGAIPAAIAGFVGHLLADWLTGSQLWYSWAICSALLGGMMGWILQSIRVNHGRLDKEALIRFNVLQIPANILLFSLIAPTLDVFFFGQAAIPVFAQGWIAGLLNGLVLALLGTLLLYIYSALRKKFHIYE